MLTAHAGEQAKNSDHYNHHLLRPLPIPLLNRQTGGACPLLPHHIIITIIINFVK